jgi:hypothetical protein
MTEPAQTNSAEVTGRHHGVEPPRGLEDVPHSSLHHGFFGRMFRTLPPLETNELQLLELGCAMFEDPKAEEETDDGNNDDIPAGYTYLGQFIDHDVTFDPTSRLQRQNDPDALTNFRTPRLDLDSVYGAGPSGAPYLYDPDGIRLRVVQRSATDFDLPREAAKSKNDQQRRALIGDPRNDENAIISQLHVAFLRFHNEVVKRCPQDIPEDRRFEYCQRIVRWHYQWLVVHDFLPKIVGQPVVDDVLGKQEFDMPTNRDRRGQSLRDKEQEKAVIYEPNLRFFNWENLPFVPVEFATAAYRFGHSMVRKDYALNPDTDGKNEVPIFLDPNDPSTKGKPTLAGFRDRPKELTIDWQFFFPMANSDTTPQASRKIDTRLNFNLSLIPGGPTRATDPVLALPLGLDVDAVLAGAAHEQELLQNQEWKPPEVITQFVKLNRKIGQLLPVRNLARGLALGLPSGQDVARAMGVPERLILDEKSFAGDESFAKLGDDAKKAFGKATPLWYYILREADLLNEGLCLGPVGGRIVAEVLIGLLWGDRLSYLRSSPAWQPEPGKYGAREGDNGKPIFGMPELLDLPNQPISDPARDVPQLGRLRGDRSTGAVGMAAKVMEDSSMADGEFESLKDAILTLENVPQVNITKLLDQKNNDKPAALFMYRRRITPDSPIPPRLRPGLVLYYVESVEKDPENGLALLFQRQVSPEGSKEQWPGCIEWYGTNNDDKDDGEIRGEPIALDQGHRILVSNASYGISCLNGAAVVLLAGIEIGQCAGHPCP